MTGTPPWFPQAVSPVSSFSSQRFLAQILRDCSLTFCRSHVCSTPRSSRASDAAAARSAKLHCGSSVTRSASRSSSLLFHSGIAAAAVQRITTARTHASISSHEDFAHRPALPSLPPFSAQFCRSAQLGLALGLRHSLSSAFASSFLSLAHGYGPLCVASVIRLCHCGVSVFTSSSRPWATCACGLAQLAPRLGQPGWPSVRAACRGRGRTCYTW